MCFVHPHCMVRSIRVLCHTETVTDIHFSLVSFPSANVCNKKYS